MSVAHFCTTHVLGAAGNYRADGNPIITNHCVVWGGVVYCDVGRIAPILADVDLATPQIFPLVENTDMKQQMVQLESLYNEVGVLDAILERTEANVLDVVLEYSTGMARSYHTAYEYTLAHIMHAAILMDEMKRCRLGDPRFITLATAWGEIMEIIPWEAQQGPEVDEYTFEPSTSWDMLPEGIECPICWRLHGSRICLG